MAGILAGRKKQTRRIVVPGRPNPYGLPGDRLWVREAFWRCETSYRFASDPAVMRMGNLFYHTGASWTDDRLKKFGYRKVSPRFMPMWLSRITLEVVNIQQQRLHDMTAQDAREEGVLLPEVKGRLWHVGRVTEAAYLESFQELWNATNGTRGTWDTNPQVWALTFRVVEEETWRPE